MEGTSLCQFYAACQLNLKELRRIFLQQHRGVPKQILHVGATTSKRQRLELEQLWRVEPSVIVNELTGPVV